LSPLSLLSLGPRLIRISAVYFLCGHSHHFEQLPQAMAPAAALKMRSHDYRMEAALYWSAISLIVCEDLPVDQAAHRLGVDDEWLREILFRRKAAVSGWRLAVGEREDVPLTDG